MAFDRSKFSLNMQCATGGDVYSYQTSDPKATVLAANYFVSVARDLNVNDRINCWTGIGGSVDYVDLAVNTVTPSSVTVLSLASYL